MSMGNASSTFQQNCTSYFTKSCAAIRSTTIKSERRRQDQHSGCHLHLFMIPVPCIGDDRPEPLDAKRARLRLKEMCIPFFVALLASPLLCLFVLRLDPYRAFQHDTCRGCCTRAHATVSTTASSAYQKDQRQSAALPHRPTVTSTHCLALMRMDFVHPMNPLCNPRTFSYERSAFDGTCLWNHLCVKTFDRYAVPLSTGACFL